MTRRATASIGHLAAGLRGEQSRAVDDRDDPFAYQAGERRAIAKATTRASRCPPPASRRTCALPSRPRRSGRSGSNGSREQLSASGGSTPTPHCKRRASSTEQLQSRDLSGGESCCHRALDPHRSSVARPARTAPFGLRTRHSRETRSTWARLSQSRRSGGSESADATDAANDRQKPERPARGGERT